VCGGSTEPDTTPEEPALRPEVLPAGPDAVVVRFSLKPQAAAISAAQAFAADLTARPPEGAGEIVPALVSVRVGFDPRLTARSVLVDALERRASAIVAAPVVLPRPRRRWTIPVAFGGAAGPQLAEVAAMTGLTEAAAAAQIAATDLRVLAIGFAPGQAYIGLMTPAWDIPRMTALTPSVPAGSVVVALRQIVMFGAASPTGWRQVARAAFRSFLPERAEPMPLRAGDAIRYVAAPEDEIARLDSALDGLGGARLEMLR